MANFKDEDKINELRERLYSRGPGGGDKKPYQLPVEKKVVATGWQRPPQPKHMATDIKPAAPEQLPTPFSEAESLSEDVPSVEETAMAPRRNKKYRLIIAGAAVVFFVLSMIVSSLFFFLGNNSISGENIAIDINGPFTIGGGETIPLQIAVTNQNTVAIESATLIVTYPSNTQSATEEGKSLTVERLALDTLAPGEALNIPLRAVIFGEENDEKVIQAEIEYRVQGSNSTFAREAEPLRFKIGSSPLVINVDSVKKISSGQETTVKITLISNSSNPLTDILVKADYPLGFDFTSAQPQPVSGQNVWLIEELGPEGETTIEITGVVVGKETDEYAINYSVGVANASNPLALASIFSTATTDFEIEQPFLQVALLINNDSASSVAVETGERVDISIEVENTLDDTIYDAHVELNVSGNALTDYEVDAMRGFYDSINNVVRWLPADVEALQEVKPGEKIELTMALTPDPETTLAPQLAFDVNVRAQRLAGQQVSEQLLGTAAAVARVISEISILGEVARGTSVFTETGPIPPVAEERTTYTVTLLAENGTNDVGSAEVTASLPSYIEWLDKTTGAGDISFNDNGRVVTWNIGRIDANQSKIASFQVSFLPSRSQIGTTPTLLGEQRIRATDLFTDQVIRSTKQSLTTNLAAEAGFGTRSGEVRAFITESE